MARRGVVKVPLGCRDEVDTKFLQGGHHDGVVVAVAREPGQRVDDDVTDVRVCAQVLDHITECVAVFDRFGGLAGVDEFGYDRCADFMGAFVCGFPLHG